MRVVPTGEQIGNRLSHGQKAKSTDCDFTVEVFLSKENTSTATTLIQPKGEQELPRTNVTDQDLALETGSQALAVAEQDQELLDEEYLAEGVQLFGSLFSLIEERIAGRDQDTTLSKHLPPSHNRPETAEKSVLQDGPGVNTLTFGVVIDLAQMRNRTALIAKDRQAVNEHKRTSPNLMHADPASTEVSDREVQNGKDDPKATSQAKNAEKPKSSVIDLEHYQKLGFEDAQPVEKSPPVATHPSISTSALRIEQIVRAITDQTQEVPPGPSLAGVQEMNANYVGKTLRMNLHPVELGSVEVAITKRGKRLEVTLNLENPVAGKLFVEDASELANKLSASDPSVEHVQVRVMASDGTIEVHDLIDVPQFSSRQGSGFSSTDHKPSRMPSRKHQEDSEYDQRTAEKPSSPASQRPVGGVYI